MFKLADFLKLQLIGRCLLAILLCLSFSLPIKAAELHLDTVVPNREASLKSTYTTPVTPAAYMVKLVFTTAQGYSHNLEPLQRAIAMNLGYLPFVEVQDPRVIAGAATLEFNEGTNLNLERFKLALTDNVVTTIWLNEEEVELRLYAVDNGKFVFGTHLILDKGHSIQDLADEFCAQFMEAITGRGDFFRSTLVFVKTAKVNQKDLWIMRSTGQKLRKITSIPGDALSPSWSKDAKFIVFSHIDARTHALGVWDAQTNRVKRIQFPGNTVIGPCFMPNNKVAVGLTDGHNPSIFLLDHFFRREKKLITSSGIDVSPSVDNAGTKMVFTSSRLGNPHVFIHDFSSGKTSRISKSGRYNTDPSISPDGTLVVFSRGNGSSHKLFVYDLRTGVEKQITFGTGSDEQAEFAPDSFFIAFTSTRSGKKQIYLTTRHGGEARKLETGDGDAAFPAWGKMGQ